MKIKFKCCYCSALNNFNINLRKKQSAVVTKFSKETLNQEVVIDTVSTKCQGCGKKNFATPTEIRKKKIPKGDKCQ